LKKLAPKMIKKMIKDAQEKKRNLKGKTRLDFPRLLFG
jgi:hypothetical protein